MIEVIGPVAGVEAISLSVAAGMASRQSVVRRQQRLRWLAALHAANSGGEGPLDDSEIEDADEKLLADTRARIAAALGTIEEWRLLSAGLPSSSEDEGAMPLTAAELARRIGASGDRSLRAQARLSAITVRKLVEID